MPRNKKPTDDRGTPCTIARLSAKQIAMRSRSHPGFIPDKILREEKMVTIWEEFAVIFVAFSVFFLFWQFIITPYAAPHLGMVFDITINATLSLIIAFVALYLLINPIRQRHFIRIAQIYLSQAHCPACGYKLTGLTPESDGCILCPECNAAWKQTRIGSSTDS